MAISDGRLPDSRVEDFRIGRVVSRTFGALFANPLIFLALSALMVLPSVLLSWGVDAAAGRGADRGSAPA